MAINFPDSPSSGDLFISNGVTYVYNAAKTKWSVEITPLAPPSDTVPNNPRHGDVWFDTNDATLYVYYSSAGTSQWVGVSGPSGTSASIVAQPTAPATATAGDFWFDNETASLSFYYTDSSSSQWIGIVGPAGADGASPNLSSIAEDVLPDADSSRSLGSPTKKWKDLYLSGNTLSLGGIKLKDAGGTFKVETAAGEEVSLGGVKQYDSSGLFPTTGNKLGSMVMSKDKKGVYLWDSSEWDRMSTGSQIGPILTTTPSTTHDLNNDGTTATTIAITAVDEAGFPITYDWDAYSGNTIYNADSLPPQLSSVSESSGVFSLIADDSAAAGSFVFRSKASDGVLFTPFVTTVSLVFMPQKSNILGWYDMGNSSSYSGSGTTWSDLSGNGNDQTWLHGSYAASGYPGAEVWNSGNTGSGGVINFSTAVADTAKTIMVIWGKRSASDTVDYRLDFTNYPYTGSDYWGIYQDGATAGVMAGYTSWSSENLNWYVNGGEYTNRNAAHDALDKTKLNSATYHGNFSGSKAFFNGYQTLDQAISIRAAIFWSVRLTTAEKEKAHNSFPVIATSAGF